MKQMLAPNNKSFTTGIPQIIFVFQTVAPYFQFDK